MSLVDRDKMTQLRTASESKTTAASALDEIQLKEVAYAINSAANSGEYRVEYNSPMRENTSSVLTGKGYDVREIGIASPERLTLISWS